MHGIAVLSRNSILPENRFQIHISVHVSVRVSVCMWLHAEQNHSVNRAKQNETKTRLHTSLSRFQ